MKPVETPISDGGGGGRKGEGGKAREGVKKKQNQQSWVEAK
jgi:hypothetical protein